MIYCCPDCWRIHSCDNTSNGEIQECHDCEWNGKCVSQGWNKDDPEVVVESICYKCLERWR